MKAPMPSFASPASMASTMAREAMSTALPIALVAMTLPFYSGSRTEPLVVSGITGKADALGITYVDPTHIRLFWDHWGLGGPTSDLISIEPGRTYALEVDMGSFYPEGATALSRILSGAQLAQRRLGVRIDLVHQPHLRDAMTVL